MNEYFEMIERCVKQKPQLSGRTHASRQFTAKNTHAQKRIKMLTGDQTVNEINTRMLSDSAASEMNTCPTSFTRPTHVSHHQHKLRTLLA